MPQAPETLNRCPQGGLLTLRSMSTSGLDAETAVAIRNLLKATDKAENCEWNKETPTGHQKHYSVEDTTGNRVISASLVDDGVDVLKPGSQSKIGRKER